MKPIKIITFTPVWKRPDVFDICLAGIKRLIKYDPESYHITPFFIVSESCAAKLLFTQGFDFIMVNNNPLGAKKNEGLKWVLENYQFDYLMEIGSDDLVSNHYLDIIGPFLLKKEMQICADGLHFIDIRTEKISYYKTDRVFGLGRLIHRDALIKALVIGSFWTPAAERGMDTCSWRNLLSVGIDITKISISKPCLLDIKSEININNIETFPDCIMTKNELLKHFPERKKIEQLIKNRKHESNIL